jgi:hypothetical protein
MDIRHHSSHQLSGRPDARIDYSIMRTLYNILSFGDASARQAVREALTAEARNLLYNLRDDKWEIERMAKDVEKWTREILRDSEEWSQKERSYGRKIPFDLRFRIPGFAL